jgi:hypothetical protein
MSVTSRRNQPKPKLVNSNKIQISHIGKFSKFMILQILWILDGKIGK